MSKLGTCALCQNKKALVDSHIIPKFVFRWMKDTGGTDFLRSTKNVNVRVQDGLKGPLLCEGCEGTLNRWETQFANVCFFAATKDGLPGGNYSSWLSKFCASVVWRTAIQMEGEGFIGGLSQTSCENFNVAKATWRSFILGDIGNPGKNELHLISVGDFSQIKRPNLPPNWNRYTRRATEMDFAFNESGTFEAIHVKMGPISIFGHISNTAQRWVGTRVAVNHGNFRVNAVLPSNLVGYYISRARASHEKLAGMSEKQKNVIARSISDNLDRIRTSDFLRVMERDVDQFGSNAFSN